MLIYVGTQCHLGVAENENVINQQKVLQPVLIDKCVNKNNLAHRHVNNKYCCHKGMELRWSSQTVREINMKLKSSFNKNNRDYPLKALKTGH